MERLATLTARFSGSPPSNDPVDISQSDYSLSRKPPVIGQSFINSYSRKDSICATSWATSVIEVAEAALNNMFDLSVDQLIQCLPIEYGLDSECSGIEPKLLISYLNEVGLVRKSDFSGCESIEDKLRFTFTATHPEVPNASGLMNLVAEGKPVFVMLALNLLKLRFVKDNREYEPFQGAAYQPSVYGIVSGYNTKEDSPYWEIVSRILPVEEITVRIPITANETNANYAGIAGYAFSLNVSDPPSTPYTCDESAYANIEDIPEDATELIFKSESYPSVESIDLSRFIFLQSVQFGDNSFFKCKQIVVDNYFITTVVGGEGSFSSLLSQDTTERRLNDLPNGFIILNAPNLKFVMFKKGSFGNMEEIVIDGSIGDVSVTVEEGSFSKVEKITGDESSSEFVKKMEEEIEKMNAGKDVELVIPTESPSDDPSHEETPDTPEETQTAPPTIFPTAGILTI